MKITSGFCRSFCRCVTGIVNFTPLPSTPACTMPTMRPLGSSTGPPELARVSAASSWISSSSPLSPAATLSAGINADRRIIPLVQRQIPAEWKPQCRERQRFHQRIRRPEFHRHQVAGIVGLQDGEVARPCPAPAGLWADDLLIRFVRIEDEIIAPPAAASDTCALVTNVPDASMQNAEPMLCPVPGGSA